MGVAAPGRGAAEDGGEFSGHRGRVSAVAFSPDGERILSGGGIPPPGWPFGTPAASTPELFLWRVPSDLELWAWRHWGGKPPAKP